MGGKIKSRKTNEKIVFSFLLLQKKKGKKKMKTKTICKLFHIKRPEKHTQNVKEGNEQGKNMENCYFLSSPLTN